MHAGKCAHACVVCTYICVHWAPARVAFTLKASQVNRFIESKKMSCWLWQVVQQRLELLEHMYIQYSIALAMVGVGHMKFARCSHDTHLVSSESLLIQHVHQRCHDVWSPRHDQLHVLLVQLMVLHQTLELEEHSIRYYINLALCQCLMDNAP